MTRGEFLLSMEELLELQPGELKGTEKLSDLEAWDSLAVVSFMGLARTKAGKTLSPKNIASSECVDDLFALISDPVLS